MSDGLLEIAFQKCEASGGKTLNLSNMDLKHFPEGIITRFASTLVLLNMGGNSLTSLPDEFSSLSSLRILFFQGNLFEIVPIVLGKMPSLYMLSFKSCRLTSIPPEALSPSVEWLILTDNKLTSLPPTIGSLTKLKKCMLSHNLLTVLPSEMSACRSIELLRLAGNALSSIPEWLLDHPTLSWLCLTGNPCLPSAPSHGSISIGSIGIGGIRRTPLSEVTIGEVLGEGASGTVSKAHWKLKREMDTDIVKEVAIKVFKGVKGSDSTPEEEIFASCLASYSNELTGAGEGQSKDGIDVEHSSVFKCKRDPLLVGKASMTMILAEVTGADSPAVLLELLPPSFEILGSPPNFDTCSRDTWPAGKHPHTSNLTADTILVLLWKVCCACLYLHSKGIAHGDIYAHNILFQSNKAELSADDNPSIGTTTDAIEVRLCDMGAATVYSSTSTGTGPTSALGAALHHMEVRAFGCLVEDLLLHCTRHGVEEQRDGEVLSALESLRDSCMDSTQGNRPSFTVVEQRLSTLL